MRKSGLTGDEAYVLSKHGKTTEDLGPLKKELSQLKEDTAVLQKRQNVLVGSETGNPVSCDDAFAAPLCGLTVYGKSTQDGTPSPDTPVPIVSAGDGGSVAVRVTGKNLIQPYAKNTRLSKNGATMDYDVATQLVHIYGTTTGLADLFSDLQEIPFHAKSAVTMSLTEVSGNIPASVTVQYSDSTTLGLSCTASKPYDTGAFTHSDFPGFLRFTVNIPEGLTFDCLFKVQLELGVTATTYEPYHEQTLTLSTPNGLPGIPVTSGGNYTDQNGQQWICDEVDLERGVKVQRVKSVDISSLDKSFWIFRNDIDANVSATRYSNKAVIIDFRASPPAMSNILPAGVGNDVNTFRLVATPLYLYQFNLDSSKFPTVESWVEYLEANTVLIIYAPATPIETPLTPAEIAAYKAITAYAPDTVVQASDGAGIKLDYQRDVNLVVKNLEDAIASMTTT